MANIDKKYHEILKRILEEGVNKGDRTGTGTRSIFHHTLEYDMKDGFPLLTTKKMFTKGIITELLWFLNGSTSLRDLVEQGNNIWVGDAYKRYHKTVNSDYWIENALEPELREDAKKNQGSLGYSKEEFIEAIKTDDKFSNGWGDLGPIYGKQWVNWEGFETGMIMGSGLSKPKGINQIQVAMDMLKNNPDGRRILVSAWNPADIPDMVLPPCHWAFELYTEELTLDERNMAPFRDGKIHTMDFKSHDRLDVLNVPKRKISLKWHQRSVDVPLGLPFNIASYAFLLEMFAQQANMVPDMLIGDLTNVHIYQNQLDGVKEQLANDVDKYDAPKLVLNNDWNSSGERWDFIMERGISDGIIPNVDKDNTEFWNKWFKKEGGDTKDIFNYKLEDFKIEGYESYPTVKYPLSN